MDFTSARRLRWLGFLVVAGSLALLWLPKFAGEKVEYSDAVAGTLAIGLGLLLIAELGPIIKSFKAGGLEFEFVDSVQGKFNGLESRVAELEVAAKAWRTTPGVKPLRAEELKAPAEDLPEQFDDDPWRGRFGGKPSDRGFTLAATFRNVSRSTVEIVLNVIAAAGTNIADGEKVVFYLHDTFNPDKVTALFHGGTAELTVMSYGGFTVGAWIPSVPVELELNLARAKDAPRIVREN